MRFKVLLNCRHDCQPLEAGDIITDHRKLDKAWPSRFERISTEQPPTVDVSDGERRVLGRRKKKTVVTGVTETPPETEELEETEANTTTLRMVPKGGGRYDVVNTESNKTLNTTPLSKEAAEALVEGGADVGNDEESAADPSGD